MSEYESGYRVSKWRRTVSFEFVYPGTDDKKVDRLRVGLEHVRAANDIEIHFDLDRNGWVIESPTKFMWKDGEDTSDTQLEEVAFIPAYSEAGHAELVRVNS